MKYAVIEVVNGNFKIKTEHSNLQSAIVSYFGRGQALWNASDVYTGCIMIVDENLNRIGNYIEQIYHAKPEPETEVESEEISEPTE